MLPDLSFISNFRRRDDANSKLEDQDDGNVVVKE